MLSGSRSSRPPIRVVYLGRVGYQVAVRIQEELRAMVLAGTHPGALLLLEHSPVVTLGRNASLEGVLVPRQLLEARGVELIESDRGGQATFHGPGQLVGYPVIDLRPDRRDVRRYVRDLETVLIRTLADLQLHAEHSDDQRPIGVWVGQKKIASIGVHLKRWVTTHGFALNLNTDLTYFDLISPCGLTSSSITSVEKCLAPYELRCPTVENVAGLCARHFGDVFERGLEPFGHVSPERLERPIEDLTEHWLADRQEKRAAQ